MTLPSSYTYQVLDYIAKVVAWCPPARVQHALWLLWLKQFAENE